MYMWYYDPWFILVIAAMILGFVANGVVKNTFNRYSRKKAIRGVTGGEIARRILDSYSLANVDVEKISGTLSDHYDPKSRTVRLSSAVADSTSVAAIGVAAHEVGHAVQHAFNYQPFSIRNKLVPIANLGSQLLMPLIFLGVIMHLTHLFLIGAIIYGGALAFHLVTLPVEFDASNRALKYLEKSGDLTPDELKGARKVLMAAGMTYVAAALVSLAYMIRMIMLGRRR